ncbi:MAG: 30S ribosomal protein S9 [Candidatus Levybacteria bacterium CG_4_9_14_3_um_filter_35_16]|nr:MAG: 30S ribosomal protein S9 [Candidatus Levybacteria bacterium CG22_combo_CG10-13_8_21_14_all_35_11]PIY93902.1 MAG: 30S ribosomal protein S9 [Candidatus Levybacteria bacterium CG_4_10_14_0_8_um_filter_35_23]PJA00610.1 MAG: 30S ribosomal protein S9 [Candidatus Levybacteria bacterium CG_4_10_14_0_2_um_filter_35_8]PJA91373.1 MAG: 30S ribosomal protein S9 [Candidatus Levybacteria bacterium CG_4_9_14_3_um_filter_35_16]PJC54807.1 MAG: 30S ribosomal protein S9 [Candidatus Levybacteria bacterium C
MNTKKGFIFAVGRRKDAVARVRLYEISKDMPLIAEEKVKKGEIFVNDKRIENYFSGKIAPLIYLEPLRITNNLDKYAITVKVVGGGQRGQLIAVVHGISRALSAIDIKNRQILKKKGLLTRDPRVRQRRNVGMGGKSRRAKQSPKR